MRKALLAAAVFTAFIAQAEIVKPLFIDNELGVDTTLDYTLLEGMGPWDDRNYQLTKNDIEILPLNDQYLANVPLFFKIQYRKQHPETGMHYPRSLYQNFNGNYGGLLVDGIWYKSELGLGNVKDETYGKIPENLVTRAASNEVALEAGVSGDESAIECNPTNKNNCVAGTNTQNGQTMYYSSDAGASWTKSQTNPGSSCCDPTVDWSSDGSRVYQGDLKRSGSSIGVRWSVSTDQGHTWGPMQDITTSGSDKEFIHVDRSPSSSYQDNIYMTWHDGNVLQFARSTDFGGSFSNPISFTSEPRGIGSDITSDSAGNVYYFYPSTSSSSGIRMLKSTNGGASFAASTRVAVLNGSFDLAIPAMETRRAFIYTSADVDRNNDTIYVAWTDEENDSAGGNTASSNHAWINVSKSTNGGSSWTSCAIPHDTSDSIAAGNAQDRFHPWIKVGDDSTIHIGYYDTRHSNNRTGVDFYYSTSTDACSSWTETRFSTQTSSNLTDGQEWGDYNGLSVVLDKIAMTWTDNRSGKATFVGVDTISGGSGNANPTASFTSNCSGFTCSFNASASNDSDGSISGYSWSFGGSGVTASNNFGSYGTYSVTLTVTDDLGATGSSTQSVSLADPNASILTNGVAKTGLAGAKDSQTNFTMSVPAGATDLTFNMSGGTGDADLYVRYGSAPTLSTYDCRPYVGGNTENCPVATAQAGTYHVMIVAYSAYTGVSLTGSYTGAVANIAPTASFTSSCTDLACSFNASGSSDSDGSISSYSWSFGGSGVNASNTFASAGTYSVTLTVTDNDGASDTATSSVTVTAPPVNVAPNASFTSNCTDLSCSFNASGSSDSDGSISSYSWSFGGSGVNASNTYGSAGTYSVTLTVTDNDGATDTATSSVTVNDPPPPTGNVLVNGVTRTGLAATKNNSVEYTMEVPAGATNLTFEMSGGSGDADLYVKFGSAPTTSSYDCRPYAGGNTESCPVSNAQTGTYYVMVRAYATFSGVSLTGSYSAGGGGQQSLFSSTTNVNIPDNNTTGATSNMTVTRSGDAGNIKITYSIVHTYRGDLKIEIIAPNGATAVLREPSGGGTNNINDSNTINAGTTPANGTWGLKVIDNAGADTGYIDSWSIEFL